MFYFIYLTNNLIIHTYTYKKLLRSRSSFFTSLFTLMVPAGLPELKSDTDVDYMRSNLQLDIKDRAKAGIILESTIKDSLKTSFKQIDDLMHMMAHKHGSEDGNGTLIDFYKVQKSKGTKAPFFYYVLENSTKYKEMKQEKLLSNVGLRFDHEKGKGLLNRTRVKRTRSVDSVDRNGPGGGGNSNSNSGRATVMVGGKTKPNRKGSAGVRSSVMGLMPRSSGGGNDGTHRRSLTMDAVLEMSNTTAADDDDDERGKRDSAMSNDSFRISSFDSFSTNPMILSKMENSRKINDDDGDSKNGVEGEASSSSKSMIVPKESESSKLADTFVEKDKLARVTTNKIRHKSRRRSSWKDKHEKQVKMDVKK